MLRGIYGFDHCAKTQSPVLNGVLVSPEVGMGQQITFTAPTSLAVDQNGFLGSYRSVDSYVGFNLTGILPPNPTKVTIGFRLNSFITPGALHSLIHFHSSAAPPDVGGYLISMGVSGSWFPAAGTEVYAEVTYDFATNTVSALVNGLNQPIVPGPALSGAILAAFAAGTGMVSFRLSSGTVGRYAIRDIYIVDAVSGDGMTAPLGAQKLFPVFLDAADGAGWTASGAATPLDVLNTALPANPYATSPSDKTPLVTSLKSTIPAGSRIKAVSLSLSGTSIGDVAAINKVEVSQGGTTLAAKFVPVAKTITYGAPIGVYLKAPDGGAWDLAKLDATTVKLTPDTAV